MTTQPYSVEDITADYRKSLQVIEEQREELDREILRLDQEQDDVYEIHKRALVIFRELGNCCEDDSMTRSMESLEDELIASQHELEHALQNQRERLQEEKVYTYEKEDEVTASYHESMKRLEDDEKEDKLQ